MSLCRDHPVFIILDLVISHFSGYLYRIHNHNCTCKCTISCTYNIRTTFIEKSWSPIIPIWTVVYFDQLTNLHYNLHDFHHIIRAKQVEFWQVNLQRQIIKFQKKVQVINFAFHGNAFCILCDALNWFILCPFPLYKKDRDTISRHWRNTALGGTYLTQPSSCTIYTGAYLLLLTLSRHCCIPSPLHEKKKKKKFLPSKSQLWYSANTSH